MHCLLFVLRQKLSIVKNWINYYSYFTGFEYFVLFSALLVCGGVVLYPMGWDNREIKESCGESAHIYKIGIKILNNIYTNK